MLPPARHRLDLLGLSSDAFAAEAARVLPSGSGLAGRIYARAFESGLLEPERLGASVASARAWRGAFDVGLLAVRSVAEEEGPAGTTSKAAMACADGALVECVRVPARGSGRTTLCVSSQVGCAMGCAFCETGRGGLVRSLEAGEIVAQVLTARVSLGWDCANIVFMGMGEPLDNLGNVARAIEVLGDRRGLRYSDERITVCSAGPPGGVGALRALGRKRLNLSISLNAGSDEKRARLMPVARSHPLAALAAELAAYPMRPNFALGVNYCLIPGANDGREDARLVAAFCAKAGRCLVNVIPYNPGSRPLARSPTDAELDRFEGWLGEEGVAYRRREARGRSIMAACGQLAADRASST